MHTLARSEGQSHGWFTRSGSLRAALLLAGALALASYPQGAHAGLNVWTSAGPDGASVTALVVDPGTPGTLYAGTAGKGVFKSMDRGATWHAAKIGLGDIYIDSLAIDPAPHQALYAASPNHGVFKSMDGGETWAEANTGLPTLSAHWLAVDPNSCALYVSTNDGVFKSLDAGDNWMPTGLLTKGQPNGSRDVTLFNSWIDCLAVDPATSALYACYFAWADPTSSWDLLTSTDGGVSWRPLSVPTTGGPYAIARRSGDARVGLRRHLRTVRPRLCRPQDHRWRRELDGNRWDANLRAGLPDQRACRRSRITEHSLRCDGARRLHDQH